MNGILSYIYDLNRQSHALWIYPVFLITQSN